VPPSDGGDDFDDAKAYATDAPQRGALMLDILRERADQDAAHGASNTLPVLTYKYEVILDLRYVLSRATTLNAEFAGNPPLRDFSLRLSRARNDERGHQRGSA
jgi:hypothetical protein